VRDGVPLSAQTQLGPHSEWRTS